MILIEEITAKTQLAKDSIPLEIKQTFHMK